MSCGKTNAGPSLDEETPGKTVPPFLTVRTPTFLAVLSSTSPSPSTRNSHPPIRRQGQWRARHPNREKSALESLAMKTKENEGNAAVGRPRVGNIASFLSAFSQPIGDRRASRGRKKSAEARRSKTCAGGGGQRLLPYKVTIDTARREEHKSVARREVRTRRQRHGGSRGPPTDLLRSVEDETVEPSTCRPAKIRQVRAMNRSRRRLRPEGPGGPLHSLRQRRAPRASSLASPLPVGLATGYEKRKTTSISIYV
jgi:hypothetical protein